MGELSDQGLQKFSQSDYREMSIRIFKVAELLNKVNQKDVGAEKEPGKSDITSGSVENESKNP